MGLKYVCVYGHVYNQIFNNSFFTYNDTHTSH